MPRSHSSPSQKVSRRAGQGAEETLARFQTLIQHSPAGIAFVDAKFRYRHVNQMLAEINGYPPEYHIGRTVEEIVPHLWQTIGPLYRRVRETGAALTNVEVSGEVPSSPGEKRHWLVSYYPVRDSGKTVFDIGVMVVDITERKRAEEALKSRLRQQRAVADLGLFALRTTEFEKLLHRAVETVSQALDHEFCKVLELRPDGQALLLRAGVGWNDGLVGTAVVPAELDSQAGFTLLTDQPVIVADLSTESRFTGPALLRDHGVVCGMSVVISGSVRPFGVLGAHTRRRRDYSKDDVFFLQSVANILAEFIERRRMDSRYRLLVQSVQDYSIFMLDPAGIITTWNSGAELITGYRAEEIIGRSVATLYPANDAAAGSPLRDLQQAAEQGRMEHEGWRIRKDGTRFLARLTTFALRDDADQLLGFSRIVRDITSQRREEESLRSSVDHSVDAIITIDEHGIIQACGRAAQKIFGYAPAELIGRPVNVLMPEPWRSEHAVYLANYFRTGIAKIIGNVREVTGLRRDGSTVPLEAVITEFSLAGGRFFTGILRDVTERKKLQEQLWQSQKMEAIGQLAGGVAHDFNNLLTVIACYSEMVLVSLPANDPHRALIAEVVKAGNRASSLTSQLLAFSRKQILAPKVLNLNDVVANSEKMLRRMIGEHVSLVTDCDPALKPVRVDRSQIELVIMNLAVNARDAMQQGGTLTLKTCNCRLDNEQCQQHLGCKPGDYVVLTVTDTGCGIAPETKVHIFEPFFTTKEVGKGTGLGLATVYGIVKQSEGFLAVDSSVGLGTTFTVFLPAVLEVSPTLHLDHEDQAVRRGSETVLIVEDEDVVRKLARHILELHGYQVLEATNGPEALNIVETSVGPIDLMITDVVMPGMSGQQLAEIVLPRRPKLKVLYMSGYLDVAIVRGGGGDATDIFLQKPFSTPSLTRKVRDVLDCPL
ncbi:MAG: PAS domain S-box protein [Planctomycetes bacterium]|nr:PAS domain S-box protein [Planctomycetota bacterium]